MSEKVAVERALLGRALRAFKCYADLPTDQYPGPPGDIVVELRAALAAPVQGEPVAVLSLTTCPQCDGVGAVHIDSLMPPPQPAQGGEADGYALAMRVLQSDLYHKLDELERAQCDALIAIGPDAAPPPRPEPVQVTDAVEKVRHAASEMLDQWRQYERGHLVSAPLKASGKFNAALDVLSAFAPQAPAGWKLVQVEPTDAMRNDGKNAWTRSVCESLEADEYAAEQDGPHSNIAAAYRAMLAAAPVKPEEQS